LLARPVKFAMDRDWIMRWDLQFPKEATFWF